MIRPNIITGGEALPTREWKFEGFNGGVNTFGIPTELRGIELAQMTNAELYGKRSVRPRRGGERLGAQVGSSGQIDGLFQYKEPSVNEIMALINGTLKKYNSGTGAWNNVSGGSFTANLRTRGVKMRSRHYFGNGVDNFARYNGTAVATFTAVAAPTGLAVTQNGSTGTSKYGYTITTVTDKGESLPCTLVEITNGNANLSTTNNISVVFNRRTESQVIGYNVYGRSDTGIGRALMIYVPQPASGSTVTFTDTGSIEPNAFYLEPDGDSTDGPILSIWEQLRGSIVGAGDPSQPDRMFFSGTGERYESFSPAHNGGWVDVRPGDNDKGITGFAPFESKIIVGKQRSIHQFTFSSETGDAVIQELLTYTGVAAPGAIVVMENDVALIDSERRLRILGYEPNFTASIRTTSLSEGRVQSLFDDIATGYIENIEMTYHNGRLYIAYTPTGETVNKKVLKYDRRYLSFIGVDDGADAHVRCWLKWDGSDGKERLYAGSSDSGYVYEYGVEGTLTNHDSTAVTTTIRTKNEDLENSGQQKLWKWADMRIYRITGTLILKTILNGATVIDERSFSSSYNVGWGAAQWGSTMWGASTGVGATASDLDQTYRKEIYEIGNSLQFELTKSGTEDDFVLVSMRGEALLLPTEVFDSANII